MREYEDEEKVELAKIYEDQNGFPPYCKNCKMEFTLCRSSDEEDCYVFALDEKDHGYCSCCSFH